mgnify:FL=1
MRNVVRGAQDGAPPARWQSCLGRFPSPLETTKMAFRRLWHAIEVPHTPSSATQSRGRPSARESVRLFEVLAGYPPRHDGASPPLPTTCATSVLSVCGWALAPRTAHPRVGSALGSFTWGQCSTVSGCAAHYHTLEQPQSLSTRRTCVPRGRGSTTRPITPTHGPEDSTSRDTVPARAISASLHAPHSVSWPHTDNPNPRHDGHERDVQAGWGRGGRTVRGDCPRSRGRRMGVIFHRALRSWF